MFVFLATTSKRLEEREGNPVIWRRLLRYPHPKDLGVNGIFFLCLPSLRSNIRASFINK